MKILIVLLMLVHFSIANADIRNLAPNQIIPLVPEIKKRADAGDANAQFDLSGIYARGIGLDLDPDKAKIWMRKAAENNHPEAQNIIAFGYYSGHGAKKDIGKAFYLYKKSAESGFVGSMAMLGDIYNGRVYRQYRDFSAAKYWFKQASDKGNSYSAFKLGCYAFFAIEEQVQNTTKAYKYFDISAKRGHQNARFFLDTQDVNRLQINCDIPRLKHR